MVLNAWKNGETIIDEVNMNAFLALQNFQLIYGGIQRAAKAGAGVTENDVSNYSYCARFTLTGSTEISRVELEVDRDGGGADLIVQVRSGMNPASGGEGTILKQVVVPKEFIPDPKGWWSVPIGLTGLTSGSQYWLVVLRAGDAVNHNDWIGENAPDGSYPAYRRAGTSGNWTANNALHFRVFSGIGTGYKIKHVIIPEAYCTILFDEQGFWKEIYTYCPRSGSHEGGIRQKAVINRSGSLVTSMEVV